MPNSQKEKVVEQVTECVDRSQVMIMADYRGLTVAEMEDLRAKIRESNGQFTVIKNRLMKIALGENPAVGELDSVLKGPTGVAFGFDDPVALAKALLDYEKDHDNLELKGGILGTEALNLDGVKALSKMPDLPQLRGMLAGSVKDPIRKVAIAMDQPAKKVAFAANNLRSKMVWAFQNYAAKLEEA